MLTLLTQRITYHLGTSSTVGGVARAQLATTPIGLPSLTRRSFLTGTPRLSFAAAVAEAKKLSAKKTNGTKKTAASKAKAKPKVVPKKKVAAKKTTESARPKFTKADMPPGAPPNAYIIFYSKYYKGLGDKPTGGITATASVARQSAELWKNMSEAEKQPYRDEAAVLSAAHQIKRQNYFDSVPPSTLANINKQRKLSGKKLFRRVKREEDRKPLTSFFRFVADFRATPDAQNLFSSVPSGRVGSNLCVVAAGKQWKAMTEAQKAPYVEASNKDIAAWKARQTTGA